MEKHDAAKKRKSELRLVRAMNVSKIKSELIERGVDVTGFVDKRELVNALVEAR